MKFNKKEVMSEILITVLTKTKALRWIATMVAGLFVTWGVLSAEPVERRMQDSNGRTVIVRESKANIVAEALTLLLVGAGSLLIEGKKDSETRKTQELLHEETPDDYTVVKDGLSGPETREAVKIIAKKANEATEEENSAVTAKKVALNPNRKG